MQAPQSVHRWGSVIMACLRCFSVSRVMICSGQAATQRPQPEHRLMLMAGTADSDIAKQILLLPFLDHLLFFVQRVVARAGSNHCRDRLLAGSSAAGTELVGWVVALLFSGRSRFHTPLTFVLAQGGEDFFVLGAVRKQQCGGVPSSTPHKPLCSVTRSGRKKIITLPRGPL